MNGSTREKMPPGHEKSHAFIVNSHLLNPFQGDSHSDMQAKIRSFMVKADLERIWMGFIERGAFLAQDPRAFEGERDDGLSLDAEERKALAREAKFKWDQPFIMYALVACCSLSAAVQGWDESAINQAQVYFQPETDNLLGFPQKSNLLFGLVNGAPYLCCATIGCWLNDPLNRLLGRRGTIFLTCLISSLACLWQGFTNTWWHLLIARLFLGLGIGPKSSTVPIYAAECAPKNVRGSLVMMWQLWTAFGILLGLCSGVILQPVSSVSLRWKLIIGSPCILPLIVCAYIFTLPESPRWLLAKAAKSNKNKKYYRKAFHALCRLRRSRVLAARDLFLIHYQLEEERKLQHNHNRFLELFTIPRNRRALVASFVVMFAQQFCGVNVFAYYSTQIFQAAINPNPNPTTKPISNTSQASLFSLGFGLINFVFAFPAIKTIDTFGRRSLLLVTFPFMAIFQLWTGLAFNAPSQAKLPLVAVGMYMFCVAYSPGEGPVPFVYAAESMPLYVRDLGMSIVTAIFWFWNFMLAFTFPLLRDRISYPGAFSFYAAWCVICWVLILLLVPETKNQTLEELDARFEKPTAMHAQESFRQCISLFRRHVLRRKLQVPLEEHIEQPWQGRPRKKILVIDGEPTATNQLDKLASIDA